MRQVSTMTSISNSDDLIDVRDVIERVEELTASWADATAANPDDYELSGDGWLVGLSKDDRDELVTLLELLDDLKGNGGDHQWNGDWYPVTLIRDSYFTDYTMEMLEDCGYLPKDLPGWIAIDWDRTADAVRMDYTSVELDGITYWTR